MPRFFFDLLEDGRLIRDTEGHELPDTDAVRKEAMRALPEIAYHQIQADGDRQSFVVVARDEAGRAVYTATLGYSGLWLHDRPVDRVSSNPS